MRRWWLMIVAVAGLLAPAGCALRQEHPDGSGTIECTQVDLAPQVSARLLELTPEEGDPVVAGACVARLDPTDAELRRTEAGAGVAAAQAQLDLLLAGSREEDIQRARAQVREAEAVATAAQADLRRIRPLHAAGTATQKQLDDAQALADRTAASQAAAEQQLVRLEKGNRAEEIKLAEAQVQLARARLAVAEKAVADCVVTSSVAGVVTTRIREPGEWVSAGMPLLTISRLDEVWLSVYVTEPALAGVKLGQPARVKVDGRAEAFTGTVTYVSPTAEFTPRNVQTPDERAKLVYRVKITLPNPDGLFKPGMPADGYLH